MSVEQDFEELNRHNSYEDDGVYGDISDEELKKLMDARKQRYTEGINKPIKSNKTISKTTMIAIIVAILVYYMVVFGLNVSGVISYLMMVILMVPVALGAIIWYLIMKKNSGE